MKKIEKISKIAGLVLLAATVVFGLCMKLFNAQLFDLYIEYFFKAITPLNILALLTVVALILGNWSSIAESIRKSIVGLKRQPSTIPLLMMVASFLVYSFNLTKISNTTALVYGSGMGLCEFVMMLFSVLAIVCMLNAFPKRKKPVWPMVGLTFVMFAAIIYAAVHYRGRIYNAVTRDVSPIDCVRNPFIMDAYNMLQVFIIMVAITAALVALMPVYSKLLKKINTSVDLEYSDDMGEIEIED